MVWKGESLVGHRVAQIKFDPFLDLLSFSMWLCATTMQKKHQQISNLEIYSDQHYTNSLQQLSITHYADNYRWMYYDCLLLCFFILSFIQCSREKNNMNWKKCYWIQYSWYWNVIFFTYFGSFFLKLHDVSTSHLESLVTWCFLSRELLTKQELVVDRGQLVSLFTVHWWGAFLNVYGFFHFSFGPLWLSG